MNKKEVVAALSLGAVILDNHQRTYDPVREERQERLENKFFGNIKPKKGHRLYKYNFSTNKLFELTDEDFYDEEIKINQQFKPYTLVNKNGLPIKSIAEYNGKKIKRDKKPITTANRKIRIEVNTYYFTSLNQANAIKHIKKMFNI